MARFVVGDGALFPERLDDYLGEDNPVRGSMFLSMSLIWPVLGLAASSRR
jgi:hypothetical protein